MDNPVVGYLAFAAVKLVGYTLAALLIGRWYRPTTANPPLVGIVRTFVGMAGAAILFFATFGVFERVSGRSEIGAAVGYYGGLVPVRMIEWWLIVRWFYDRSGQRPALAWQVILVGTVWSYVCDVPAMIGLAAAGGIIVPCP